MATLGDLLLLALQNKKQIQKTVTRVTGALKTLSGPSRVKDLHATAPSITPIETREAFSRYKPSDVARKPVFIPTQDFTPPSANKISGDIFSKLKTQPWSQQKPLYGEAELSTYKGGKRYEDLNFGEKYDVFSKDTALRRAQGQDVDWSAAANLLGFGLRRFGETTAARGENLAKQAEEQARANPNDTLAKLQPMIIRGLSGIFATPAEQIGSGIEGLATDQEKQIIGGKEYRFPVHILPKIESMAFGALGATPTGAIFNAALAQPEVKKIAEGYSSVKQSLLNLPVVKDLPDDAKEALSVAADGVLFGVLHKAIKLPFKKSATRHVDLPDPVTGEIVTQKIKVPLDREWWANTKNQFVKDLQFLVDNPKKFLEAKGIGLSIKDISSDLPEGGELQKQHGNKELSDAYKRTERGAFNLIAQDEQRLKDQYRARFGNEISADNAKELFPEYIAAGRNNSDGVHKPSSYLANKIFDEDLLQKKDQGNNTVLFTAGGTGVGKTSSMRMPIDQLKEFPIIYDSNLKTFSSATDKINRALDNGYKVDVKYILRDPMDAWTDGVLKRGSETGRVVKPEIHTNTHVESRKNILKLINKYKNNPDVHIRLIDNSFGSGNARLVENPIARLKKEMYTKAEAEQLTKSLHDELGSLYQQGRLGEAFYRATKGAPEAPRERVAGIRRVTDQELEPERARREDILNKVARAKQDIEEAKQLREAAPVTATFESGIKTKADYDKYIKEVQDWIGSKKVDETVQPAALPPSLSSLDDYISELTKARDDARAVPLQKKLLEKTKNFYDEVKSKIIDYTAPIEHVIRDAQKRYDFEVRPQFDISYQIDRAIRAPTLAGQFVKDYGLANVIKSVPDLNKLDQYLIAKQALKVKERGFETGRDVLKDKALVGTLGPQYEMYANQVTDYGRKLLDYSVESGLVNKELAASLKKLYPDYVPLKRVFNALEETNYRTSTKALASLSKQTVVEKLKGSERQIESPIESLMTKTNEAFAQGEKNKAARILAGYKDLPGFEKVITELKPGEKADHTFSYLDNGEKRTFKTTQDIAEAAKRLNVEQIGLLQKLFNTPVRIFKVGTTGLEPSFIASNVVKDQLTAFINSRNALKTSILNPVGFVKGLFSVLKHDDLYQEMVSMGGGGTSFDIVRQQVAPTVARIRAGRDMPSKIKYTVTHPGEMFRALEDIIGRSEELGRVQQYRGTKEALLQKGRTPEDAKILAAKAAIENTANFYRKGEWASVMNTVPYLNAGIQGTRAFLRSMARDPIGTTIKAAATIYIPMAATTAWNLADPARKKAYDDIRDFEKENNFIIIPPNPIKDEKTGKWNVIKMPMPQEVNNLSVPIRRIIEQASGDDPVKAQEFLSAIVGTLSPINPIGKDEWLNKEQLLSSATPQLLKPAIEWWANKDLFTGKSIVPKSREGVSPELQVNKNTSGTARMIGKQLNASPAQVEHLIRGYGGKLSMEILNAIDGAFSAVGIVPSEQVGGVNPVDAIIERFTKASGGVEVDKIYAAEAQADTEHKTANLQLKQAVDEFITNKDKEGLTNYYEGLDDDQKKYLRSYIKSKAAEGTDQVERAKGSLSAEGAIKYYGIDLERAIKERDIDAIKEMVDSLDSQSAKDKFKKYIMEQLAVPA